MKKKRKRGKRRNKKAKGKAGDKIILTNIMSLVKAPSSESKMLHENIFERFSLQIPRLLIL